mgnify:CR=1 FL=1
MPRSPLSRRSDAGCQPWLAPERSGRVLDLCTGSGCIAIACAHALPDAQVDASDISEQALAVCRRNIDEHGLGDRVAAVQADGLTGLDGPYDLSLIPIRRCRRSTTCSPAWSPHHQNINRR